ncbi:uncharacterized protein [Onthophagus taurus]|uniref:uncharacterized protein n=1 Tax=Onthophagus taurus TaxID=166361 RepID=UPI000C20687C|nr:splicing factor 3B subunit 4-like [Onthophagus taurus]
MKYIILLGFLFATTFAEEEPQAEKAKPILIPEARALDLPNEQRPDEEQQLQQQPQQQEQQLQQLPQQLPQQEQQEENKRPQRHLLLETYETPLLYSAYQTQYLYQYPQPLLYYQPSALFPQPYVLQKLAKK